MKRSYKIPRLLVLIASLILAGALVLPIWRIELSAPQYPEGLALQIFANGIKGDVDIINGLNHYIGMKELYSKDFVEFTVLPYILIGLILAGLITVVINRKRLYYTYIALFLAIAILSMVDFYRWEYNYGHDLNPHAAIQVPGMAYQPPLIGYKQLLNFGAFSIPDSGGWLFIAVGALLAISWLILLQPKWLPFTTRKNTRKYKIAIAAFGLLFLQSCSSGPQPIQYGQVACDHCKMMIMDKRFACEWVSDKGKVYKFDDLSCMQAYRKEHPGVGNAYVNTYDDKKQLAKAEDLYYASIHDLGTPMVGNIAAFANAKARDNILNGKKGNPVDWSEIDKELNK